MIRYGGNTTCVEVELGKRTLIIDAGTGIHRLGEHLMRKNIKEMDIFITHSHWDHIQGFPFFKPIYSKNTKINILGCTSSYKQLNEILSHQMSSEYFPVAFSELKSKINFTDTCNLTHEIEGYSITFIRTNHPIFTLGIRIEKGSDIFVFITDNELKLNKPTTNMEQFVKFCRNAAYLVHDAQFLNKEYSKRKGWGHSTFEQVIKLGVDSGVKNLGFTHHDPNRTDTELAVIERYLKVSCKKRNFKLKPFVVKESMEIKI